MYLNDELLSNYDLVIPDTVTSIGSYLFVDCTFLRSVYIPHSVKTLGKSIFYGCVGEELTINCDMFTPDVEYIGDPAFAYSRFAKIIIGQEVRSIEKYELSNNGGFSQEIVIQCDEVNINGAAFEGCTGHLTIDGNINAVRSEFYNLKLSKLTIGPNVSSISLHGTSFSSSISELHISDIAT